MYFILFRCRTKLYRGRIIPKPYKTRNLLRGSSFPKSTKKATTCVVYAEYPSYFEINLEKRCNLRINTYQLKCATDHDCNMRNAICDVYPADEIPRTLRMCKGFIVNTYPHQKPGKHWIVFFYGCSPDGYSVYLRQFMGTFHRSNDTAVCVQYCLFYLMCRTRCYSMDQITDMFS